MNDGDIERHYDKWTRRGLAVSVAGNLASTFVALWSINHGLVACLLTSAAQAACYFHSRSKVASRIWHE